MLNQVLQILELSDLVEVNGFIPFGVVLTDTQLEFYDGDTEIIVPLANLLQSFWSSGYLVFKDINFSTIYLKGRTISTYHERTIH